jgi:hypothetical protein
MSGGGGDIFSDLAAPPGTTLDHLRDHLITAGLVRKPRDADDGYPLWLVPYFGVPAPGESPKGNSTEIDEDLVAGAFISTIPLGRFRGWERMDAVEFIIRARKAEFAQDFYTQLRQLLNDKRSWDMAGIFVFESLELRGLQLLSSAKNDFTYTAEFSFDFSASQLISP